MSNLSRDELEVLNKVVSTNDGYSPVWSSSEHIPHLKEAGMIDTIEIFDGETLIQLTALGRRTILAMG